MKKGGNIGLPFGLCEKYGIQLPPNARPRNAWAALKNKTGMSPEDFYKDLRQEAGSERVLTKAGSADEKYLNEKQIIKSAKERGIQYRAVYSNTVSLSPEEIVSKVGGGDKTEGSCVSVALAYIGNLMGYNVLDYRGGESQQFFAKNANFKQLIQDLSLNAISAKGYDDFKLSYQVLEKAEKGKKYLLLTGKHAALVRRNEMGFEYLELQSATDNGYKRLSTRKLKERLGCQHSHTIYGNRLSVDSFLVDLGGFKNNRGFQEVLGYLNTAQNNKKKGIEGYEK